MRVAALALVAVMGCVHSESVMCGDRACPGGTECDDVHMLCIDHDQRTACNTSANGDACTTSKRAGICDQNVCLPGCTDGVADPGEECDDGNRVDHDGCSATCVTEEPTWTVWQSPWTPRSGHMAAYDSDRKRVVVFGGADANGATDDLWERDTDGAWTQIDITRPSSRAYGAMAYDPVRKVTVLFGGASKLGTLLRDTWEYDGTSWKQITPPTSPTGRAYSAMVFDPIRQRITLVDGLDGVDVPASGLVADVWQYDGTTWTQLTTTGTPPPRRAHALAWDTARQRLVMFGGIRPIPPTTAATSETWELSFGTSWTWTCTSGEATSPSACPQAVTRPTNRYSSSLVYSPLHNTIVMYGGLTNAGTATQNASDTWTYGATGWTATTQAVSPGGRSAAALSDCEIQIDATTFQHRPVLIGGSTDEGATDEVWELTSAWLRTLTPGNAPPRYDIALSYDAKRDRTVSVGGYLPPLARADTFVFDGKVWKRQPPLPAIRFAMSATYDSTRELVGVFGGLTQSSNRTNETYALTGLTWMQLPGPAPSPRYGAALAHDPRASVNVLFGGNDMSGTNLRDTWELDMNGWSQNMSAGGPPAQLGAAMAFDPERQELVLFDGAAKTWLYTNRVWTPLETTASPPARNGARLVYFPSRKRLVLYGGVADNGTSTTLLTDMWELDTDGDARAWHEVVYANPPPPRRGFGFVAHASLDSLVLRAGQTSSGEPLDDTWLFRWQSAK
ncbi:MAG TPA: kelch repeat-containing protein [Kofleriaceae bacterium]|nr:kelch repeat-containing protein [Kofleriaceae bacterium]